MSSNFFGIRQRKSADHDVILDKDKIPAHVAIIMDGNGRWAKKRSMPRTYGHKAGAEVLRNILTESISLGVKVLTAYAFSTENWRRPEEEVNFLMELFATYLDNEVDQLAEKNVRLHFIGSKERLGPELMRRIFLAEQKTAAGNSIILNLAVDYGGRAEIVQAVRQLSREVEAGHVKSEEIDESCFSQYLFTAGQPDPDLLIRPGGDMRISNFLLWQLAYSELWITDVLWPDFTPLHFRQAIQDFQNRERRFGGLKPTGK